MFLIILKYVHTHTVTQTLVIYMQLRMFIHPSQTLMSVNVALMSANTFVTILMVVFTVPVILDIL